MGRKKKKKKAANEKEKLETMAQAAGSYSAMRPYQQLAQNRAMHQQLSALQPANNILGMMYGNQAQSSGGQFGGIISPEMFAVGQTSKDPNQGPVQWDPNAPPQEAQTRRWGKQRWGKQTSGAKTASGSGGTDAANTRARPRPTPGGTDAANTRARPRLPPK